jgi:hypothetical protein
VGRWECANRPADASNIEAMDSCVAECHSKCIGSGKSITIEVGNLKTVKITEAISGATTEYSLDARKYPSFFDPEIKTVKQGKVTISLGKNPVYIEPQR